MKTRETGLTLIEVLVATFLMALIILSVGAMFVFSMRNRAGGADMSQVGAAAEGRMELLRNVSYGSLTAGGSVTSNVTGYFDNTNAECVIRWSITDNATPATRKTVVVAAIARRAAAGNAKSVTLRDLRAP